MAGATLRRMKHPLWGTPGVRRWVLARAIIGFISISAYFYRWFWAPELVMGTFVNYWPAQCYRGYHQFESAQCIVPVGQCQQLRVILLESDLSVILDFPIVLDRKRNLNWCSIQILPLRDATVLNFTTPVFTIILATVFLKESWSAAEAAGEIGPLWRDMLHHDIAIHPSLSVDLVNVLVDFSI